MEKRKISIKKNMIQIIVPLSLFLLLIFMTTSSVYAEGERWGSILTEYDDYFSTRVLWLDVFRGIGWAIIKGVFSIVNILENFLNNTLEFFGFVVFLQTHSMYTRMLSGLVAVLMAATLVWIGYKMIINQGEVPQMKSVLQNTVVVIILILGMPNLMGWLQEGVTIIWGVETDETIEDNSSSTIALTTIQQNVTDLYPVLINDSIDWNEYLEREQRNLIYDQNDLRYLNAFEFYPPANSGLLGGRQSTFEGDPDNARILDWAINAGQSEDGTRYMEEVYDMRDEEGPGFWQRQMGDAFEVGYYRFSFNFFTIVFSLIMLGVAYVYVIFNIITVYVEMGFKLIGAPAALATDLETGQKTKKVFNDIIRGFLTVSFEAISFRMYTIFLNWLSTQNVHWILYLFALTASTIVLIKGATTISDWFGVDTGLQEGRSEFSRFLKWSGLRTATRLGAGAVKKGLNKTIGGNKDKGTSDRSDRDVERTQDNTNKDDLDINDSENYDVAGELEGSFVQRMRQKSASDVAKATEFVKKSPQKIGEAAGYMKERGVSGTAHDLAEGTGDLVKKGSEAALEAAKQIPSYIADHSYRPPIEAVTGAIGGLAAGYATGQLTGSRKAGEEKISDEPRSYDAIIDEDEMPAVSNNSDLRDAQASANMTTEELIEKDRKVQINEKEELNQSGSSESLNSLSSESRESLRKIKDELEQTNFDDPEESVRYIHNSLEELNIPAEEKAILKQELQKASDMTPEQGEQHVRQVLNQAIQSTLPQNKQDERVNVTETKSINESLQSNAPNDQKNGSRVIQEVVQPSVGGQSTDKKDVQVDQNIRPVSDISHTQLRPLTQAAFKMNDVNGNTMDQKIETIKQNVLQSSKEPEIVEQSVKLVTNQSGIDIPASVQKDVAQTVRTIRTDGNAQNLSDEVVKQRIQKEVSPLLDHIPTEQRQKIVQDIQEVSAGNTAGTRRIMEQVEKAKESTPIQVHRNVTDSFKRTTEPLQAEVQRNLRQTVDRVTKDHSELNPQQLTQKIRQEVEKVDFGQQASIKPQVLERLDNANVATPRQVQTNLRRIVDQERDQHMNHDAFSTADKQTKERQRMEKIRRRPKVDLSMNWD